ncbi:MAG: hypothetical protein AMQ22_00599 [Candidatus Methanofastidiosum methylothiophilum]|uniref:Uncharacterized protein n=1 Tax=Candidatus Methanofastidiosum methylothiophilum TaxID=1705564 RepID=A0A150J6U2_9EURY|nr:MAG: hypothetical protein AMQ22_00599 [Candidatus Methanofastidiosum methylthiophilus]
MNTVFEKVTTYICSNCKRITHTSEEYDIGESMCCEHCHSEGKVEW